MVVCYPRHLCAHATRDLDAVGVVIGSACVLVGASVGAVCALLLGRYLLQDTAQRIADKYRVIRAVDRAIAEHGFKTVFLLRLSPLIPFNALNYVLGVTTVSVWHYSAACSGMIPGTVLYVYLGSLLSDLKDAADGKTEGSPALRWTLLAVGVVTAVAAVVVVTVYARRVLKEMIAKQEREESSASLASRSPGSAATGSGPLSIDAKQPLLANP